MPTLTQDNPYHRDYNSITPNTGYYNAINRETVITSFKQGGQHPLTGQRAANFRLLANQ